jgi:Holliday junction resolvase
MVNSKQKGKRGELELANVLKKWGYDCHRGQQFKGTPDSPDIIGLPGIHIECKRVQALNLDKAMEQATNERKPSEWPTVFHRKNGQPWMVTMRLDDWMVLYLHYRQHQGRLNYENNRKAH